MKSIREHKIRQNFKWVTSSAAVITCLFLFLFFYDTQIDQSWKSYQNIYRQKIIAAATDSVTRTAAQKIIPEIQHIELDQLNRVDRCISCHRGINDKTMMDEKIPIKTHSLPYLNNHFTAEFGCTICHGGRGRALQISDAHSPEHEDPFLQLNQVQSNCGRCHLMIFRPSLNLSCAESLETGLHIFQKNGCLGCHKIRGTGGSVGPDLTRQGEKPRDAYNFEFTDGDKGIDTWLQEHFKNPQAVSPDSKMPAFNLPYDSLFALIILTRALFGADLPLAFYSGDILNEYKSRRNLLSGDKAYAMLCIACHQSSGNGRDYKNNIFGVPNISNVDFLAVASDEFLYFTLREGRGSRVMGAWENTHSGIREEELGALLDYILKWKTKAPDFESVDKLNGDSFRGSDIYHKNCAFCHGNDGEGGLGPGLNRQSLFAAASDRFLYDNITGGRSNTAMPSWSHFTAGEVADLIRYIRNWQQKTQHYLQYTGLSGEIARGDSIYYYACSRCHGVNGTGGIGPAILNKDFLKYATDIFLYRTIAGGRDHSAMFGFSEMVTGPGNSGKSSIHDIISFLRSRQDSASAFIEPGANLGDPGYGQILYRQHCAGCHGFRGEGTTAPQLNNQELLNAASNGYLLATISLGRSGTKMPSWGRGSPEHPALNTRDRRDIVAFIREWQKVSIPYISKTKQ